MNAFIFKIEKYAEQLSLNWLYGFIHNMSSWHDCLYNSKITQFIFHDYFM